MEHGHTLMLRMISNIENLDNKVFIEVGTTREHNLSSFVIAKFCNEKYKSKYEDILGDSINNESCYNMHLDCCVNSIDNIKVGGYIIDDVLNKSKKTIPYLLKNGFEIVKYVPNCILLKKV